MSIWVVFLVLFVVGPALGWGWRAGRRWDGPREWYDGRERSRGISGLDDELARRDAVIEALEARVAELENRVDFAERLLATGARRDG